ncbi:MAG: TrbG/VirB9 family P-type conjugative transfer protein [Treponema sp.]|nr:TrbG/VirB9 family P-type conjugative transfer protein [Treponema sp.]MBQ7168046.1 TrbG/VirB9 family P-type conjugative transfer protein [Treponema sp.]
MKAALEAEQKKGSKGKTLTGTDALNKALDDLTVVPKYEDGELRAFVFKPENIYQVHCQTYHTTIIQLQPGEEMLEVPYISETSVWKLSRGTGLVNGLPTVYLMLKPDKAQLDSTMIIITDRRVYQLQIKSYQNHYMPYCKWTYNDEAVPVAGPLASSAAGAVAARAAAADVPAEPKPTTLQDIIAAGGTLSFNYKWDMGKASTFSKKSTEKPSWYPTCVFDDGQKTYIILDEKCLNMDIPAVLENKDDIINTQVTKNCITINKLVTKIRLRLGKTVVDIEKVVE